MSYGSIRVVVEERAVEEKIMIYDRQQTRVLHGKEDVLVQLSKHTHQSSLMNFARPMSSFISRINHQG